ncbi:DUF5712 family protein [Muricauda sp. F6463D]|nr:DUF5712 family protein [Muricauda sp. F6463D]MCK0160145.1 DUF5712 family protein [Muricauda sp. F6463D]
MEDYAKSFHRNQEVKAEDQKYYVKIEHERTYRGSDKVAAGMKKREPQTQIHTIVSRRDVTNTYTLPQWPSTRYPK